MNKNQKKVPIVISSEMARKRYEDNLLKLQNYERDFMNKGQMPQAPQAPQAPQNQNG